VFCIHSTDAKGNRSSFSPTPEANTYNLATVGAAVDSWWPPNLCSKTEAPLRRKSGTSFATPIAASIAAFLLLYARTRLEPKEAQSLKRYSVMKSVLCAISIQTKSHTDRDGYQYLHLSRNPDNFFGNEDDNLITGNLRDIIRKSG